MLNINYIPIITFLVIGAIKLYGLLNPHNDQLDKPLTKPHSSDHTNQVHSESSAQGKNNQTHNDISCRRKVTQTPHKVEIHQPINAPEKQKKTLKQQIVTEKTTQKLRPSRSGKEFLVSYSPDFLSFATTTDKRYYGYFKCSCGRWWESGFTWINSKGHSFCQKCQGCGEFNGPSSIEPLIASKNSSSNKPHDQSRCGKCISLGGSCL
ncbi:hypothetical protein AKO1_005075, partial [Acrasis kona]